MNTEDQKTIQEICKLIKDCGYRCFIAEKGNYGFYTDTNGSRVVCFSVRSFIHIGGNYKTSALRSNGTGWTIGDFDQVDSKLINTCFYSVPTNRVNVTGSIWRYTTLQEHLDMFNTSSKYTEM
jgi:hypothetical protein